MRPRTIITRASLAALLSVAPVLVLAGPATAAVPVSVDDTYAVDEDDQLVAASVLANDTDADADPLTAVLVAGPADGTLTLNADGTFLYTPNQDFNGTDSFTYQAIGAAEIGNAATVTITVNPTFDPVVANPDTYSTPGDVLLVVAAPGVLANDVNPDGPPLFVGFASNPVFGTLVWFPDGSFTYDPFPGYRGTDTFVYVADNGFGGFNATQVTLTVGNVAPVADPDSYDLAEDTTLTAASVLVNDSDANGDPLSAVLVGGPSNGTLALATDGTFTYTPVANFNGVDSFTYTASDGTTQSGTTTVTLTVDPVGDSPVFADPILAVAAVEDTTYTGQTTATSADGLALTYTAETTGTPTGTVVMNAATGAYTFTPEPDFVGLAQLDVFACDTFDRCASQLINITVSNTPDAPVATDQVVSVSHGAAAPQMFDVRDIDSQVLTFAVTTAPRRGTVAIDADMWTFVYTPAAGTSGRDTFVVSVCDEDGLCDSATVTVDVAAAPVAPVAPVVTSAPAAAVTTGTLPVTGADVTALAFGALGLVGLGGVLVARSTRRRTPA